MARGYKDYRQVTTTEEPEGIYSVHGRIKLYDDFENSPIKWGFTNSMHHDEGRLADAAYNGSFGMRMCCEKDPTEGEGTNEALRYIPMGERRELAASLLWRRRADTTDLRLDFWMQYNIGTHEYAAGIRYDVNAPNQWRYYDSTGWHDIQRAIQVLDEDTWNALTFAANLTTNEYMYVTSNEQTWPICGIPIAHTHPVAPADYTAAIITIRETGEVNACVDFDDVLIREL